MRDRPATFRPRLSIPDPGNGEISQEATKKAVKTFYSALYTPIVSLPLAIPLTEPEPLSPFLHSEALHALASLKRGHSAGADAILPDMLFHCRHHLAPTLTSLLNFLCQGDPVPEEMVVAVVTYTSRALPRTCRIFVRSPCLPSR